MKKIMKFLTHRLFIIGLFLLIQIIALVIAVTQFEDYLVQFYFFMIIIGFMLILKIINNKDNPSYKIAWIIPILTIPIFGTLFYLILGNKSNRKKDKRLKQINEKLKNNLKQDEKILKQLKSDNLDAYNQAKYLLNNNYPTYQNTSIEYLKIGQIYFENLKKELNQAKHFIFLEYFIINNGKMWSEILEILKEKAKNGVDVRIIYDDMGCITTLPARYYNFLKKYNIKAYPFNKFVPILSSKLNNRDHRKIVVIDGKVGFTGGINLADEYINEITRFGYWKDNGIMLKGEAVFSLTVMFLTIWDYITKQNEDYNKFKPNYYEIDEYKTDGYVIPFDDNPLDEEKVGETVYLNLINKAKRYIYITTPYLILDNEMEMALKIAAKSGIEVKIITPGIPDKKAVNEVTKAYYNNLIESGIKIYEYTPGFIHEKMIIVDDLYAIVGTINLDYRSFYLHFECGVLLYKNSSIKQIKKDYENTLLESKEIFIKDTKIRFLRGLKRAILRLFAPLM